MNQNLENYIKKNRKVIYALIILGYITSGFVTWRFLSSISHDTESKLVWTSIALICEAGKAVSIFMALYKSGMQRVLYFCMWMFLVGTSVLGSMGYMVVENNRIENEGLKINTAYQQQQDTKSRITEQIATKRALLAEAVQDKTSTASALIKDKQDYKDMVSTYNTRIKVLENQLQSKQDDLQQAIYKKYVSTPDKLRSEIAQISSSLTSTTIARDKLTVSDKTDNAQANIDRLNAEIDTLNAQLNNSPTTTQTKAEKGYMAVFELIGSLTGFRAEILSQWFYLLLAVAIEVFISMLYCSVNETASGEIRKVFSGIGAKARNWKPKRTLSPTTVTAIGFQPPKVETKAFDDTQVKAYTGYMQRNATNNISPGYREIANAVGISHDTARKIRGHLEQTGMIQVSNNRTYLV